MSANDIERVILMADDDYDDCAMVADAFKEKRLLSVKMQFVHDGEALTDYLQGKPPFDNLVAHPRPGLILLDLRMPRKDGYSALAEIKASAEMNRFPVIVFSTSKNPDDIAKAYRLGAASYLTKPDNFDDLVRMMRKMTEYWFRTVQLPVESSE